MNYNPAEDEIAFVNSALAKFNELENIPAGNKKFHLIKEL
jgi:hypothetical protein